MDGRLLMQSVLRPIGQHLVARLRPQPGELCVDIGASMAPLLARAATAVTCVAIADDADALDDLRDELDMLGLDNVGLVRARASMLPLRDGCASVVTSLFAADPAAAQRILHPQRGRMACALWTEHDGVVIAGRRIDTTHLPARTHARTITDVARFDGISHYEAAIGAATTDLAPYTAPDGTLRIPTTTVIASSP